MPGGAAGVPGMELLREKHVHVLFLDPQYDQKYHLMYWGSCHNLMTPLLNNPDTLNWLYGSD